MIDNQSDIFENRFLGFIEANHLCQKSDNLLLGVSGGVDSMVMMHLFQKYGFRINVGHVNFLLRGEESDKDELFVKEYCNKHKINFFSVKFETAAFAWKHHLSIEMAARKLRYDWFSEICKKNSFDKIAVAHNKNDHVETVLLNLCRGTSLKGLRGILPSVNKIIRPMLSFSRSEIEAYAQKENILYSVDSSNKNISFHRNRIRLKIIPELEKINPSLTETVYRNSLILSKINHFLEEKMGEASEKIVSSHGQTISIDLIELNKTGHSEILLYKILEAYELNFSQFDQIIKLTSAQTGKQVCFNNFLFCKDRNSLTVSPYVPDNEEINEIYFNFTQQSEDFGNLRIELLDFHPGEDLKNSKVAYVDADKVEFPLILRNWASSDRFIPYGMNVEKKVSDFLTDIKIPVHERKKIKVLISGKNIIWIAGIRIADPVKISEETNKILKISLKNNNL